MSGSSTGIDDGPPPQTGTDNICDVVLAILDDVGPDMLRAYQDLNGWNADFDYPRTPWLEFFAAQGVRFDRFYGAPVCSPLRASVMTGLRAPRHRLGFVVNAGATHTLADVPGAKLATLIGRAGLSVDACGKWHLGRGHEEPASPRVDGGFRTYAGKLENPNVGPHILGGVQGWTRYQYTRIAEDGTIAVTKQADALHLQVREYLDALERLAENSSEGKGFCLYKAFHCAHGPFGIHNGAWVDPRLVDPVSGNPYHTRGLPPGRGSIEGIDIVRMQVETCDTMLGGLWSSLSAEQQSRTVLIIAGDNGTDPIAVNHASPSVAPYHEGRYPTSHFKGSTYESGCRTFCIVYGGAATGVVGGRRVGALVEGPDLFPTVLEAIGARGMPEDIDGRSLWPLLRGGVSEVRDYAMSQSHRPLGAAPGSYTRRLTGLVNKARWKLVDVFDPEPPFPAGGTKTELYDLVADPFELDDRWEDPSAEAEANRADLLAELARILEPPPEP